MKLRYDFLENIDQKHSRFFIKEDEISTLFELSRGYIIVSFLVLIYMKTGLYKLEFLWLHEVNLAYASQAST